MKRERKDREDTSDEVSVAKVVEITAASTRSFEDAVSRGIERATRTLDGVKGAWVQQMTVDVDGGRITEYRVNMKVTFVLGEK